MMERKPIKTIDDAFVSACKKNKFNIFERKKARKSFKVKGNNDETFIISDDFTIKKEKKLNTPPAYRVKHLKSTYKEQTISKLPALKKQNSSIRKKELMKV